MTINAERLVALEEEAAHLRLVNEELSSVVHEQWSRIEKLEKKLAHLEIRLTSFEDFVEVPAENTKPPHW
ncbi:MAG: SlyX family protein [Pseudomonadota bacterium]